MTATDLDALWAAAVAAPHDDGLKLILADACADADDHDAERALRWCAENHKWPTDLEDEEIAARIPTRCLSGRFGWFGEVRDEDGMVRDPVFGRLPWPVWEWYMKGEVCYGGGKNGVDRFLSPYPLCRDNDIRVVLRRLGQALEWAGG